jgi:hypothetical protein
MGTLLIILDFVMLLLLIRLVIRSVRKELPPGPGSLVFSLCLALVLIVFGFASFASYLGLVESSSSPMQRIFFVILLVMAASASRMNKSVT